MNTPTPRSKIILDHIKIYVEADNAAQSYAHYEEVNREIESMERELAAAREELAKAGVGDYKADYFLGELTETGKLRSELKAVTEQRDRLAEDLKQIYNVSLFDYDTMPEAARKKYREVVFAIADKALQSLNQPTEP